ncbi:hypothetical protein KCU65_g7925, partial [Aureobasidium melanogenum]
MNHYVSIEDLSADRARAHRAIKMLPTDYLNHLPITAEQLQVAAGELSALVAGHEITQRDISLAFEILVYHSELQSASPLVESVVQYPKQTQISIGRKHIGRQPMTTGWNIEAAASADPLSTITLEEFN